MPNARWMEKFQFCEYGGRIPFSTVSTVVGCGKEFAVNGFWPCHGSVKSIGGGSCRACVHGSALSGACSGPPTPLVNES